MLTPRRIEIFKAVVDDFIQNAEPVGSKTLQTRYHLPYSSATIRNDLQALEEMGYLEKTHTSSGRVPSTMGYKFYCENLLSESSLDKKMEVAIRNAFETSNLNVEDAVQLVRMLLHKDWNILNCSQLMKEMRYVSLLQIQAIQKQRISTLMKIFHSRILKHVRIF